MAWKSLFSGIACSAVLFAVLFTSASVSAQTFRNRKSNKAKVSSNFNYRKSLSANEFEIFQLVNRERQQKGLDQLAWDDRLAQLARSYSRQMARETFFSHFDPEGNSVVERAQDSGIRGWNRIGENLFFCEGYSDFNALALRGWMNSTEHRRNILERRYNASGIGIAQSGSGQIYITQIFVQR